MPVMPMHSVPARIFLTTELGLQGCVQDVFDPLLAVRGPTVDVERFGGQAPAIPLAILEFRTR